MKTESIANIITSLNTDFDESSKTILLGCEDIYKGSLILVNKSFPIKYQTLNDSDRIVSVSTEHPEILLNKIAANMLSQLIAVCKSENQIVPVSGYRTLHEQEQIFADSIRDSGEEFTKKYVALPNHSEHQTGLAIDVAENKGNIDFICPDFPYDGICQLFRSKASQYGFIERYPKGKEEITGISHEPWHFRYIGYPHSEIVQKNQYTLEEYIDFLKTFPYEGRHYQFEDYKQIIEIFYVKAYESQNTVLLSDNAPYQISGNNDDGFIITVWRRR